MATETVSAGKTPAATRPEDAEHLLTVKAEQLDAVTRAMTRLDELGDHELVGGLAYVAETLAADVKSLVMRGIPAA